MDAAPSPIEPAATALALPHGRAGGFAVTVQFELVEGAFAEFHRLVVENAAVSVEMESGCWRFDVLIPVDSTAPTGIFLYEIYASRAAFELHLASDHFRSFDQRTRAMVVSKTVLAYAVEENARPADRRRA